MPRTQPFDEHSDAYDDWFDRNDLAYKSELEAVRALLPDYTRAVEVGVGTGRFAVPLGIDFGVEPSRAMAQLARSRGVRTVEGVAEDLPIENASLDLVLMVTTVCFVDDLRKSLGEANRILVDGGYLVIGFLDRGSELGRFYEEHKSESPFYEAADFRSAPELLDELSGAGFGELKWVQTISEHPGDLKELSSVSSGYGTGLFVVVRARKLAAQARVSD
jgi:SAM-dependent methyltransferase